MDALIQLTQTVGLPVALVLFFVWHGHREKTRLADRLTQVEDLQRTQLTGLVRECTECIAANTEAAHQQTELLERIFASGCGHAVEAAARRVA